MKKEKPIKMLNYLVRKKIHSIGKKIICFNFMKDFPRF